MKLNGSKQRLITAAIGFWVMSSAIAGCNTINPRSPSATTTPTPVPTVNPSSSAAAPSSSGMPEVQQWTAILKGDSVQGLTFTIDGSLSFQGKVLLTEIPVTYVSDGDVMYAQRLIISDPSPSGRFNVIKACEGTTNESGLCWAVFLVDRQLESAEKIGIAKYGGQEWVQWTADERYAVFAESTEGITFFVALDLESRESKMFEQTSASADLSTFRWIDDRAFEAKILCDNQAPCTASPFRGNITTLFAQ
ncbi:MULTISPECIES: hypothetical protein [unclassified Leptolyngbya]|uniref:hypothetical protein n=1 Tax=unclassified Leptolyngbya TaxID=2650499 RepID=UPI00168A324E|nr:MULTISPECIES: hypothetical protein [unclassified Leptolyngbya]MBD1909244.1 hypothetical protein [Leptolyngbya sp. FACHB-8]MBD2156990.1 hypothetical protein [Leptolyngbya sp. FACHB-16]